MGRAWDNGVYDALSDNVVETPDYYRTRVGKLFEFKCRHYMGPGVPEHSFLKSDARFILCKVHTPIEPGYGEIEKDMLTNWAGVIRSETAHRAWGGWSQVIFEVLLDSQICYYCFAYRKRAFWRPGGCEMYRALFEEIQ